MPTDPLAALLEGLALRALGSDRFEGRCIERARPRVFGGDLLAQTLAAAAGTVAQGACHALHLHFLAAGRPEEPIEYRVRRLRDGRRFAHREVSARQGGRDLLLGVVAFTEADGEAGPTAHQHETMPDVAGPEGLESELAQRHAAAGRLPAADRAWLLEPRAVEVRPVRPVPLVDPAPVPPVAHTWLRAVGRLPDEAAIHRAVLAYASDTTLLDIACYPLGLAWTDPRIEQASLNHAMWFHRPFRADEWLLYAQLAPVSAGGRALARGSVFRRDGALVASVVQEGVSRLRPPAP
jgi:acyl-CoA thioesterase-2